MPVKCETVIFNIMNARTLRLTGGTKSIKTHKFNEEIVSLEIADKVISLGETISVKNNKFKVNLITKKYIGNVLVYELHVAKQTKSNIFVLPMLSGERKLFFYDTHLVNTFIGVDDYTNCIVLLYKWSTDPLFLKFEEAIKKFRNYKTYIDVSETLVSYIFDVPKKHKKNYKNFINGKYSELEPSYKTQLLKFHGMNIDGQIGQILFKSEKRKQRLETKLGCKLDDKAELYSIIDPKFEIFNPNYYI
tara:strand:+ start:860 stop:1600 length:741 start_codon:yes stop_codon:yes gene_type:complete